MGTTCPVCGEHIRDGETCPTCGPITKDDAISAKADTKPKGGDKKGRHQGATKSGKK